MANSPQRSMRYVYEDIIHWRRNLFKVPFGKAGKAFVTEIAGALEAIALKSAMILLALLLQKPSASSKAKDHIQCLDWWLKLWREGDNNSLVQLECVIQSRFLRNMDKTEAQTALTFAKLMMKGKVKAPLRHVSNQSRGGILYIDNQAYLDGSDTVRENLTKKHPPEKPIVPSAGMPPGRTRQGTSSCNLRGFEWIPHSLYSTKDLWSCRPVWNGFLCMETHVLIFPQRF